MKRKHQGVQEWPLGSGRYRIDYYDAEGKRRRELVGSEKLALQVYRQRRTEIWEGRYQPKRQPRATFRELAQKRMEAKKTRLSPRSYETDDRRLQRLNRVLGDLPAAKVTPAKIESFLRTVLAPHEIGKGKKPRASTRSTANRYRALISSIFSHGVHEGLVDKNPAKRVDRMREPAGRIRFLDLEEERAIRAAAATEHAAHAFEIDLAIQTGMRRGEQWGMRWQDVDLENSIAHVEGKSGRRQVRLNGAAKNALIKLNEIANGSPFVSPDKVRDGQGDFRRWFERSCKRAGVDGSCWHTMRHTFVSRLVMLGVPIPTIQKLAGHRSVQTTMRYAHLAPEHEKAEVERLSHFHGHSATSPAGTRQQTMRFQS
ncbi:MAG: tyrosine-type recombinase/integrase [Candidatus Acidiferrales bacterium]